MRPSARASWRSARFIVIDVETTGLDARRDEIISFAAVPVEEARVVVAERVRGLVRPRIAPPAASVEVHGLRAADLEAAPAAPEALAPLLPVLEGRIPVTHRSWVERTFLSPVLRSLGSGLARRGVDTALLWRLLCIERGEDDPGWRTLTAIATALGLPFHRPHEAEGDALTTAQVFLALATHLESHGRGSVRELTGAADRVRGWQLWHPGTG